MTDPAILQARLAEAEAALHKLSIGASAVSGSHQGKSVTFRKTDMAMLRAYIQELKAQLGTGGRARSIRVRF